ncbi:MAG: hemerythrin domain-containing protein [Nitrosomonadaceae bacterium]|nr:hemerythrin domain-containing protein [Nitrosomonadaceae bacterium]
MAKEIFNLRKEHVNFKKLLNLLDAQLDLLHRGEDPDYQLMTDILYYMTQYSDLIHHPREEAIFSLLLERDSSAEQDVAEITRQHHTIGDSGACFYEKLESIINGESEIIQLQEIEAPGDCVCWQNIEYLLCAKCGRSYTHKKPGTRPG